MAQFRNLIYLSDRSGTAKWRRIWPIQQIDCIAQGTNIQADYSQTPVGQADYYKGITSITVQRWISSEQVNVFTKFFKPICDANCGWLIYEIDDNMSDKHIPLFNRGRGAFEGEKIQNNIKTMLNAADFVTVTTDYLKDFYHNEYDVPLENIVSIPNLLPRFLFSDRYNVQKKVDQFKKFKARPRIGIVSSLSHYNVDNVREDVNGKAVRKTKKPDGTEVWVNQEKQEIPEDQTHVITDDLDEIIDCIRSTINEFRWVFFGYVPPKLKDLVEKHQIDVYSGVPIMNYPSVFDQLQLQAVIAPIKNMEFNRCKSFIKYMESAALGVPCFASNYLPYSRIMPKSQLFESSADLTEKLRKLKFASVGLYTSIIEQQWKWLNSPAHEGDFDVKNFWLEDNIEIWADLFRLRQKTVTMPLSYFIKQREQRLEEEKKHLVFKGDDGVMIIK